MLIRNRTRIIPLYNLTLLLVKSKNEVSGGGAQTVGAPARRRSVWLIVLHIKTSLSLSKTSYSIRIKNTSKIKDGSAFKFSIRKSCF